MSQETRPVETTEHCPNCGKDEVGTFTADDWFLYGQQQYRLVAKDVLFFRCMACGLEYTGEDGEDKRLKAVQEHLARLAVEPTAPQMWYCPNYCPACGRLRPVEPS